MSFIEGVKKKFFGDESQVQKAPEGGRRIGAMGKAYTGGGGGYISTSKGTGFDASSYSDAKPKGKVSSLNEFNPNRTGAGSGKEKGVLGKAYDYVAPKAKSAGKWMQERGAALNEQNSPMKAPRAKKKTSARVPRRSQPPGYDGSFDMFGGGGMGMGGGMDSDMFGVGNFGGGGGYEREEREAPRRRRKSRRRPSREEREDAGGFDMNHVPDSLRGMF